MPLSTSEHNRLDHAVSRTMRQALLLISLLMTAAVCLALDVPYLSGRVVDNAQLLSPQARERISELSRQHEARTSNQIAVLTVPTLESQSIEEFAVRVFEDWKLGQHGKDNGTLLVIARQERSLRIEVGYGLEGTLPDVIASRIIRDVITPQFKNGNYDAGVTEGMRAMMAVLEGRAPPTVQSAANGKPSQSKVIRIKELPLWTRLLIGGVIFGLLGAFTVVGLRTPGSGGWAVYLLMLPFWVSLPMIIVGFRRALIILAVYLLTIPAIRAVLTLAGWYKNRTDWSTTGGAGGGFGRSSSRGWSTASRSSGRSRSFSGGGGRSGGGGASGRW